MFMNKTHSFRFKIAVVNASGICSSMLWLFLDGEVFPRLAVLGVKCTVSTDVHVQTMFASANIRTQSNKQSWYL